MDRFETKKAREATKSPPVEDISAKNQKNWPTTVKKLKATYIKNSFTATEKYAQDYKHVRGRILILNKFNNYRIPTKKKKKTFLKDDSFQIL